MTIRDLASITGLNCATIGRIEAGKEPASMPTLRILSQTLDVPIPYLGGFETLPEETLGQRIRKARLFHGLAKVEFARAIGVDVHTIATWEKGKRTPSTVHLAALEPYLMVLRDK